MILRGAIAKPLFLFEIYLPATHSEVIIDTVKFISRYIPIPETPVGDHIKRTANDLVYLLLHKSPVIPVLQPESSRQAIIKLVQILYIDTLPDYLPVLQSSSVERAQTREERLVEYYLRLPQVKPSILPPSTTTTRQNSTSKG